METTPEPPRWNDPTGQRFETPTTPALRMLDFCAHHRGAVQAVLLGTTLAPSLGILTAAPVHASGREAEGLAQDVLFGPRLPTELASAPEVRSLSDTTRTVLAAELARHPIDGTPMRILTNVVKSPGFATLSEVDQGRLLRLVGGTNETMSEPARWRIGALTNSDEWRGLTAGAQHEKLTEFLKQQSGIQRTALGRPAQAETQWSLQNHVEVPEHAFGAGTTAADKYDLTIDGRAITLVVSKADAPAGHHKHTAEEVARGFAAMPSDVRKLVNTVWIEPGENPSDAYWRETYGDPELRAYMTAGSGKVSIYPSKDAMSQDTLAGTLLHEVGHILSENHWGPITDARWGPWKAAILSDGFSASRYAHSSPGEDFSESLQLYLQTRGKPQEAELRGLLPQRFQLLDALLKGQP